MCAPCFISVPEEALYQKMFSQDLAGDANSPPGSLLANLNTLKASSTPSVRKFSNSEWSLYFFVLVQVSKVLHQLCPGRALCSPVWVCVSNGETRAAVFTFCWENHVKMLPSSKHCHWGEVQGWIFWSLGRAGHGELGKSSSWISVFCQTGALFIHCTWAEMIRCAVWWPFSRVGD